MDAVLVALLAVAWVGGSVIWGLLFSEGARERRGKDRDERDAARRRRRERLMEE